MAKRKKSKYTPEQIKSIQEQAFEIWGVTAETLKEWEKKNKTYTLAELRKSKKMTQEELGEKFGVTKTTIFQWENGWRTPSLKTIEQYLDFFGVKFEQVKWRVERKKK